MSRMTFIVLLILPLVLSLTSALWAQAATNNSDATGSILPTNDPSTSWFGANHPVQLLEEASKPDKLSASLEVLLLMTVLTLVPAILVMTTSFTRIIVVLALLRQAMGTQQLPPSQVLTGLALFMTFCVMTPTWNRINNDAIQPYVNPAEDVEPIDRGEAWSRSKTHIRNFMITQIDNTGNTEDVYMFAGFGSPDIQLQQKIKDDSLQWQDISLSTLIPAFITSELKQAFLMGFYIYLPFLIIDMVIASILMSMGMMMLPPILISLPFKLLLFVLVDGWGLVVGSLMDSFTNNVAF